MTVEITPLLALEYLSRAVNEKGPDFHFESESLDDEGNPANIGCMYYYVNEGETPTPCCIVGHVFDYAGVDPASIIEDNQLNISEIYVPGFEINLGAERILAAAQSIQDTGGTWGEAYRAAADSYMNLPEDLR